MMQQTIPSVPSIEQLDAMQAITRERMAMKAGASDDYDRLNTDCINLLRSFYYALEYVESRSRGLSPAEARERCDDLGFELDATCNMPDSLLRSIAYVGALSARLYELVEYRNEMGQPVLNYPPPEPQIGVAHEAQAHAEDAARTIPF